jgi:predicted DNA-binding transcriptional regulator AlpA
MRRWQAREIPAKEAIALGGVSRTQFYREAAKLRETTPKP